MGTREPWGLSLPRRLRSPHFLSGSTTKVGLLLTFYSHQFQTCPSQGTHRVPAMPYVFMLPDPSKFSPHHTGPQPLSHRMPSLPLPLLRLSITPISVSKLKWLKVSLYLCILLIDVAIVRRKPLSKATLYHCEVLFLASTLVWNILVLYICLENPLGDCTKNNSLLSGNTKIIKTIIDSNLLKNRQGLWMPVVLGGCLLVFVFHQITDVHL